MKTIARLFAVLLLVGCQRESLEERIEGLNESYDDLLFEINSLEDSENQKALRSKLEEYALFWYPFGFISSVNGSDELQENETERLLIDTIYTAFAAEQLHYHRTILHTDGNDEKAVEIMLKRADSLCELYPIGKRPNRTEDIYFFQIILRAYKHSPGEVDTILRKHLSSWIGDERIPALLLLAESNHAAAIKELEGHSKDSSTFQLLSALKDSSLLEIEAEPADIFNDGATPLRD